ncbi:MAG: HEAT repeat domain-containing protein [Planctomycetota bacterium]|jgi:HEAT repeat protein
MILQSTVTISGRELSSITLRTVAFCILIIQLTACTRRNQAIERLRLVNPKQADEIEKHIDNLGNQDSGKVLKSRKALVSMGPAAVEPLIIVLNDKNRKRVEQSIIVLSDIGDQRAIKPISKFFYHSTLGFRCLASTAFIKFGNAGIPELIESLRSKNRFARYHAIYSAKEIGNNRFLPILISLLDDRYAEIRERAAWALKDIGDESALLPLKKLLKDKNARVQNAAKWAVRALENREQRKK